MICDFPSKEGVSRHGDIKWSSQEMLDRTLKALMNPNIVSFPACSPSPKRFQVKGCTSASQEISRVAYFRVALSFFWIELHIWYTDIQIWVQRSSSFKHTWFRLNCTQTDYCFTSHMIKNCWKAPEPTDFPLQRILHTHTNIYSNPARVISNKSSLCVDTKGCWMNPCSTSKNAVFTHPSS